MKAAITSLLILTALQGPLPGSSWPRRGSEPEFVSVQERQSDQDEDTPPDIKCSQLLVHGSSQLTAPEVSRLLAGACENPTDQTLRERAESDIVRDYKRRGFLDVSVSWSNTVPSSNTASGQPVFMLTINEGGVYRVRSMDMIGNRQTADIVIRRRVVLEEGATFDEDKLDLSIDRLNRLGIFEELTRDDVTMTIDPKHHIVDLAFHLKEK